MANTTNIDLVKPAGTDHALVSVLNANSDKIDAEAGRLRGNFAGTYNASSAYAKGSYCIYQGNLYRCTTAIGTGGESWNSGHWTQVSVGEELTALSDQIANRVGVKKTYTIPANGSVTVPSSDMPKAYIAYTYGNNAVALTEILGNGYGAGTARHKIFSMITSSSISYTQSEDEYGLIVASSAASSYTLVIISLF